MLMVMSYHHSPMRVAKDNLRTHIDKFIRKEQTAFEHLLVNEHRALALRSHHEHNGQQVRCQARPRSVGDGHNGAIDERLYLVTILLRNEDIIATLF